MRLPDKAAQAAKAATAVPGAAPLTPEASSVKARILDRMGSLSALLASGAIEPPGRSSLRADAPPVGRRLSRKR